MKGSQIFGSVLSLRKSVCFSLLRANHEKNLNFIHKTVLRWLKFHSLYLGTVFFISIDLPIEEPAWLLGIQASVY